MATLFISIVMIVAVCFSIVLRTIYLNLVSQGFEGSQLHDVIQKVRIKIMVPYGFISAFALVIILVPFLVYSKKLSSLLKTNSLLKGEEFQDQRKYINILSIIFMFSFFLRFFFQCAFGFYHKLIRHFYTR